MIVGYRGGNDVFLAMQRGEVQFPLDQHLHLPRAQCAASSSPGRGSASPIWCRSIATVATRRASTSPRCRRSPTSTRRSHGKLPSGPTWDALNWLTNQIGEMTFVGFAPHGDAGSGSRGAAQGLRGRVQRSRIRRRIRSNATACHSPTSTSRAARRSSARSPTSRREVLTTLRASIAAPN